MRKILTALGVIMLVGVGCGPFKPTEPIVTPMSVSEPNILLELPKPGETKKVTFMVGVGQTGGMGSMPVVDENGAPVLVDDLAVYADTFSKEIQSRLPDCYSGLPRITISATISLEKKRELNQSIPGPDDHYESYYTIVAHSVDSVSVQAEPCE